MRFLSLFLVGIFTVFLAMAAAPIGGAQDDVDADVFFSRPIFNQPSLSPDGKRVSVTDIRNMPRSQIIVSRLDGTAAPLPIDLGELDGIYARWVSDERLIILAVKRKNLQLMPGYGDGAQQDRFVASGVDVTLVFINADGSARIDVPGSKIDPRRDGLSADALSFMDKDQRAIAVYIDDGEEPVLHRIDIDTGEMSQIAKGDEETIMMRAAASGQKGLSLQRREKSGNFLVNTPGGRVKFDYDEFVTLRFEGYSADGQSLYIAHRPDNRDRYALYRIGPDKKMHGPLAAHPRLDFSETHNTRRGEVLGAIFTGGPFEHVMFNPRDSKHIKGLQSFFGPQANLDIVDTSKDGTVWMVYVDGPQEPGAYYVYDRKAGSVDHVLDRFAPVNPKRYSPVEVFDYTARDGQGLYGFLTSPEGATAQTPLLVLPHGGPHAQDDYGFDSMAQYFAARGYRVFQPQFRGSTGRGVDFEVSGYLQWGGVMQDDVSDGVNALVANGKATMGRIAIAGFSYGGYAALWGAVKQPELYSAAVAVNPVSDIADQIAFFNGKYWRYKGYTDALYGQYGDPEKDADYIRSRSPLTHIAELKTPTLLIHGTFDDTVPVRQSRALSDAAKAAGVPLEFSEVAQAGHSLESDVGQYTLSGEQVDYIAELKSTLGAIADHLDSVFAAQE